MRKVRVCEYLPTDRADDTFVLQLPLSSLSLPPSAPFTAGEGIEISHSPDAAPSPESIDLATLSLFSDAMQLPSLPSRTGPRILR